MLTFLTTPVPHAEARQLISTKPVVVRKVFDQLPDELKSRAFTISGIEDFDVMQAVQDQLAALPAGADWGKVKKDIASRISPWLDEAEAGRRAELLMKFHGFNAYLATDLRISGEMQDIFPYKQWLGTLDSRERASHVALEKVILPADHPRFRRREFGCRCQWADLTQEDYDEEKGRDRSRGEESQRVMSPAQIARLDAGMVTRGPSQNFPLGEPVVDLRDVSLPYDKIKTRWSPEVATAFEDWAGKQEIGAGGSLMNWLTGTDSGLPKNLTEFATTATEKSVPVEVLAGLLKAEPTHPVAQAVKLWGDDEKRFSAMMMEDSPEALEWRKTVEATLSQLKPLQGQPELYRGWSFETAEKMESFMQEHREGFEQKRSGMSASLDPMVAAREKFSGGPHSMIWVLQGSRRAVDGQPLFKAVEAVSHLEQEQETIIPKAVVFRFQSSEPLIQQVVDSTGKTREMRVFYLTEQ